jgi:hypothetical protein
MKELVVVLAAILAIGALFSGGKPKPEAPYELMAEGPECRHPACRAMKDPHPELSPLTPKPRTTHKIERAPGIHKAVASS